MINYSTYKLHFIVIIIKEVCERYCKGGITLSFDIPNKSVPIRFIYMYSHMSLRIPFSCQISLISDMSDEYLPIEFNI